MTYEEAKTKPLNELVGDLMSLNGEQCVLECKDEMWKATMPSQIANKKAGECEIRGYYDFCPQRIAYERVMEACERATQKKPNIDKKSGYSDFKCPSCNTKIISKFKDDGYIGKKERYCHVCGQRLDWSSRK